MATQILDIRLICLVFMEKSFLLAKYYLFSLNISSHNDHYIIHIPLSTISGTTLFSLWPWVAQCNGILRCNTGTQN